MFGFQLRARPRELLLPWQQMGIEQKEPLHKFGPQLPVGITADPSALSCEVLSSEPLVPSCRQSHPVTVLAPPAGLPTRVVGFLLVHRPGKIWGLINHPLQ